MKHFDIKKGEWPKAVNGPSREGPEDVGAVSAALLGSDVPGLRPCFEVGEGARVDVGQVVFRDRKHPEVSFVSPMAGRVSTLAFGPRRTLSICAIKAAPMADSSLISEVPDPSSPRYALLERGFWPAFRTRPFGRMPAPDASPAAIFVNAVKAGPEAADPSVVLAEKEEEFAFGLRILSRLTEGKVFVCQSPGEPIATDDDRVVSASFGGSLASGLASTHVDRLFPADLGREVWTVGYQDVAAMGHLFLTGLYNPERVVAIGGPAVVRPRFVRTCLGVALAGLCEDEDGEALSGDAVTGRRAAYLGRFDDRVTLVEPAGQHAQLRWLSRFRASPRAVIPTRALERVIAVEIPPVPLLRALAVGDSEAARRLGCLALVEEDVAAFARHCTSGADYALLLRHVLDDLMEGAA